jgi:GntR family transcriptional regulator
VLASFTESMRAAGMSARTEVISAGLEHADKQAAERLDVDVNEQIISLTRLRFGDDTPLCLEYSVLRAARFPGLLGLNLEGSLYELLRKRYDVKLSRAELLIQQRLPRTPPTSSSMRPGGPAALLTGSPTAASPDRRCSGWASS